MISDALKKLESVLQAYISAPPPPPELVDNTPVKVNNVAQIDATERANDLQDQIIITLVNIEEESSLKNGLHYRRTPVGGIEYENPPVYLNLYLLFTANFPTKYENALVGLGKIIRFFQGQNTFSINQNGEEIKLTLDLYTMTFEQINHLWGSLGGKQIPFVMYKARLVIINDRRRLGTGRVIEKVETIDK